MVYLSEWALVGLLTTLGVWAACYQDFFKILNGDWHPHHITPDPKKPGNPQQTASREGSYQQTADIFPDPLKLPRGCARSRRSSTRRRKR